MKDYQIILTNTNTALDLPTDLSITLQLYSGLLGQKQAGSYVLPFQFPNTDLNRKALNYPEAPNLSSNTQQNYPCRIAYKDSLHLFEGYFNIRKATPYTISADITAAPGNQPKNFWDKKLTQLDMGFDTLPTQTITTGICVIPFQKFVTTTTNNRGTRDLYALDFLLKRGQRIKLYINNQQNFTHDTSFLTQYNSYSEYLDNEISILNQITDDIEFVIDYSDKDYKIGSINLIIKNGIVPANCYITFQDSPTWNTNNTNAPITRINFSSPITYQDISTELKKCNKTSWNRPYNFITYENEDFYDKSKNSINNGIVNQYGDIGGSNPLRGGNTQSTSIDLKINTFNDRTQNALSPSFKIRWILEKLVDIMGYTLQTTLFDDTNLNALWLITNIALDKQIIGTTLPFNVYNDTIDYAYYMPNWTVKEFFDNLKNFLCLSLEWNTFAKTLTITKANDILEAPQAEDLSQRITINPAANIYDPIKYQLAYANAEDNLFHAPYPLETVVQLSEQTYQKIELKFTPILMKKDIFPEISDSNNIPVYNAKAKSNLFQQSLETPEPRVCFFTGFSNGASQTSNKTTTMSLKIAEPNIGILALLYQKYLDFLNQATQFESELITNEVQLAAFNFAKKKQAYAVNFLAESLQIKLPIKTTATLKLQRL